MHTQLALLDAQLRPVVSEFFLEVMDDSDDEKSWCYLFKKRCFSKAKEAYDQSTQESASLLSTSKQISSLVDWYRMEQLWQELRDSREEKPTWSDSIKKIWRGLQIILSAQPYETNATDFVSKDRKIRAEALLSQRAEINIHEPLEPLPIFHKQLLIHLDALLVQLEAVLPLPEENTLDEFKKAYFSILYFIGETDECLDQTDLLARFEILKSRISTLSMMSETQWAGLFVALLSFNNQPLEVSTIDFSISEDASPPQRLATTSEIPSTLSTSSIIATEASYFNNKRGTSSLSTPKRHSPDTSEDSDETEWVHEMPNEKQPLLVSGIRYRAEAAQVQKSRC